MGEIADMMIDGTLCESCGVFLEGRSPGHPRRCRRCSGAHDRREAKFSAPSNPAKVACKECGRHVKATGLADHMRDKHGPAQQHGAEPTK